MTALSPTETNPPMPTRQSAVRRIESQLARAGLCARREAEALVAAWLGISRASLLADREQPVPVEKIDGLNEWGLRRAAGVPLAYLTERREFWSLSLEVNADVLVPRPETEMLVELALETSAFPAHRNEMPAVLDLGTGSGAIALALASERPDWKIFACDRSAAALRLAQRNAERLAIDSIVWQLSNWFDSFGNRQFDIVVANPPYLAAHDAALDADGLRFEPREALISGSDGLADLRAIAAAAPRHLKRGGRLLLEHGAAQGIAVRELLVAQGFAHVVSHLDLAGHERITEGQWL